ncbi:MAG TPA: glycoside hydrolase family 2 TIM barrel-domain containing protein [Ignavibacteriaceae bacterium]|nr:glycoside hydrolase family 2 TIM barrel-domain containing protein [Ignavibacteriaceae bacterium]
MKKLNGNWNFIIDPKGNFSLDYINEFIINGDYSGEMSVPSNWEKEGLQNYSGTVWYVKDFNLSEKELNSHLKVLTFNGVDYFADIWINNSFVGRHEGYFQKFYVDISEECQKNNLLIVKVTSPKEEPGKAWPYKKELIKGVLNHHDCRPGGWSLKDGQNGNTGGIWNDVYIEFSESFFIENVKVTASAKDEKVIARVSFFASTEGCTLNYIITSPKKKIIEDKEYLNVKIGYNEIEVEIKVENPDLWYPWEMGKQPLYELEIKINECSFKTKFAFREVSLNAFDQFSINGKRFFLRGTNIIPEQYLSTLTSSRIKKMVALMKEANINIVRVHAHLTRHEFYDECDKQGILIWQDFPLQWTYSESKEFEANAVTQIFTMVNQYYNHPSIVFWCCHNEPGEQINRLDKILYSVVEVEDKTRIIRIASNYEEHPYDGWYWGSYEHFAATPMGPLVTEFGAQALPEVNSLKKFIPKDSLYPPNWDVWKYHNFQYEQTFAVAQVDKGKNIHEFVKYSQDYQSDFIKTAVDFYRREKHKKINGIFQFMFIDCWPSITWSVVDYYQQPKKAYYTLQNVFQPVYVSLRLRQKKYFQSGNLQIDIWIINDLQKSFNNCKLKLQSKGKQFAAIDVGKVESDAIKFISFESIKIPLKGFKKGKHQIDVILDSNKKQISSNSYEIEMIEYV